MNTVMIISAGFAWGGLLSLLHFGGLWLCLTLMPKVLRPHLWFYGWLLVRYAVTLTGMWLAIGQGPPVVMAACFGFYVMRMLLVPRFANRGR
ncbi:ATP synthase subunit I [uncultured Pseudodesulfovibrio sp.]|uniref:ATP synthase subunit I n=1 Tax=uncultured Pseudodesulfovibrio sp. TaxID=2035858 RepID=UPI0029C8ED98|nr:ATP synthase subunit I [uncultured Pseudodesulfovibrio sp.]